MSTSKTLITPARQKFQNRLDYLLSRVTEADLRCSLERETAKLRMSRKFGLVFEEHMPEHVRLYQLPIAVGAKVVRREGKGEDVFNVISIEKRSIQLSHEIDGHWEDANVEDLVVIKKFGEPIYPSLVQIDHVTRAKDKPNHAIINAENFHALQLLLYCYEGKVDVIYIDPPYNTGARDWKYNNNYVDSNDQYRHSKWLSMMKKRLMLAKKLLKKDGVLIVTIDDNELFHLGCLLEEIFPMHDNFTVTIEHNKRGRRGKNFAKSNEWAFFLVPNGKDLIQEEKSDEKLGGETRNLRRTGSGSKRHERPKKFYPIWVNEKTLKVVSAGDPIDKNAPWKFQRNGNLVTVWPIDEDGKEKNWHYGVTRTRECIANNELEARVRDYGIQVYYTLREKDSKKYKTVWSKPVLDASTHGSELLDEILGDEGDFDYPKSLYAVLDCLKASAGNRQNALILDFFAGSGTTLHATCLLNAEDGGRRQCILVTNNELAEKTASQLASQKIYPGNPHFEEHGICEAITWPRCKYAVSGERDNGIKLEGEYQNGRKFSEGFEENIQYLRMDYLDPNAIAYRDKLSDILPILWLMSGAKGNLEPVTSGRWYIPKHSSFAVLMDETAFADFKKEIVDRNYLSHIFIVTDSEEAYREMSNLLPERFKTKLLYKSYLENFRINTPQNL